MGLTKKDKQFITQSFNELNGLVNILDVKINDINLHIDSVEARLNSSINALKIYMETYFSKIDNHETRILRLEDMNRKKTS